MNDLSQTIAPKSDQLNADDLISGPRKIRIARVEVTMAEQPVSIHFEGDDGRPWKPGKSMRRVLCRVWGKDGGAYVGRSVVLFCDETVKWAGQAVGGIRISHMSDIPGAVSIPLTDKRGSRKIFTVQPLRETSAPKQPATQPATKPAERPAERPSETGEPRHISAILSAVEETLQPLPPERLGRLADEATAALFAGHEAALLAGLVEVLGWLTENQTLSDLSADKLDRLKAKPHAVAAHLGITLSETK